MQISLQKLVPDFIEQEKISASQIWNNTVSFGTGEKIQIIAPSGSGKTSLIHFLYGLRSDYHGSISYDGKDVRNFSAEDYAGLRKDHVSIVFQDLRLFPEQTVMQNLEVKRQLSPYHNENRIVTMAQRLGIENKLGKQCRTCSYGEQQRIAIIRSLQQPFEFLFLDEPFSHLDDKNQEIALQLIEEECTLRNATIILADLRANKNYNTDKSWNLF